MPFDRCEGGVLRSENLSRTEIRRKHDIETTEVERTSTRHSEAGSVNDLQEDIEQWRMCLLDFIKEQSSFVSRLQRAAQQALFAQSPSQQNTKTLLGLILRHIKAKHAFLAEEIASECERQLRLSNSGRTEEQKTSARPARCREPEFSTLQYGHYRRQHMILPQNLLAKPCLEKAQALESGSRKWH